MPSTDTRPVPALDPLRAPGPFATVFVPSPSDLAQAADRFETSLSTALHRLEQLGAPEEIVARVGDRARSHDHDDGQTLAVVANGDEAWSWVLDEEVGEPFADFGSLPRLGLVVQADQRTLPHIVVLIDREGADIDIVHGGDDRQLTVEGHTDLIQRSSRGGWSQRRFQQRVENTWEENAQTVARQVGALHGTVRPAAVFVAGDQRAVNFFVEHLPTEVGEVVRPLEHGSRADGADLDGMRTDVDRLLADLVARQTTELLERYSSARAHDGGVEGAADTLAAVFEGRVEVLLVHHDTDDERTAWFGPDPGQVAADRATLDSLGIDAEEGPLLDVAVRGAQGTGAEVWFVPAHGPSSPAEGIGAILRGTPDPTNDEEISS